MLNLVKFKDQVFPDYRIDTETAEIFDWNGNSLPTYKNHDDRSMVKIPGLGAVPVYQIQGNSFFEYKSGFDIHHKDFNKLNDALSNLDYIPHGEHTAIHKHFLNHIHSDTTKELISKRSKEMWQKDGYREMMHEKLTGKCNGMYGKHHSQESIEKMKKTREERKNTYAVWNKGLKLKPLSDEQKHVLSDKMSNMFWWNDGKINKRFRECPGEGWIKGRLKRVN